MAHTMARMVESGRAKVKEVRSRRFHGTEICYHKWNSQSCTPQNIYIKYIYTYKPMQIYIIHQLR